MTLILDEQFTGANGAPWPTTAWDYQASSGGAFTIQNNQGRMTLGAAGGYNDKQQAFTKATMTGGEYRYDLIVASKAEYTVAMMACVSGSPVNWTHMPQYGYWVRYLPINGAMTLLRNDNYTQVTLTSLSLPVVVGDVVHVAIRPGVGAWAWKNTDPRPTDPNMASADTGYTSGKGGVGVQGGGTGAATAVPIEFAVMDDLAAPEPEPPAGPTFYIDRDGAFTPMRLTVGQSAATLLWSEDFDTLDLATASTTSTARWRPNDFWQNIDRGYRDFAGTSWNLNPNETLDGAKRSAFSVSGSVLTISAIRTPAEWNTDIAASMSAQGQSGAVPAWSGGILITNPNAHKFRYGYFAIRARWPNNGAGMFPALWLFATDGSADPGGKGSAEIDLFEVFGHAAGRPWSITTHYRDASGGAIRPSVDVATIDSDTADWHVYGLDWQPTYLRFYKDDALVAEVTGEDATWFDTTMGIRLNYAMDANWFATAQKSDGTTPSPLTMHVDYVRVWDQKP